MCKEIAELFSFLWVAHNHMMLLNHKHQQLEHHYITTTTPQLQEPLIWTTTTITIGQRQVDDASWALYGIFLFFYYFFFSLLIELITRLHVQTEMKWQTAKPAPKWQEKDRAGEGTAGLVRAWDVCCTSWVLWYISFFFFFLY